MPAVTTTVTGSYATWCSATTGTQRICASAVHTITASASFGGVGGAHGTGGVSAQVEMNPSSSADVVATETGTFCDPFFNPDESDCLAYYSGNAVCSVMGA
ncbi:MAG: hypothetical protein WA824_04170 [Candidatus Sulfotelmatobacter sp.]